MDDFAFHKGHTYGTLICDLQTSDPLAILPDRSASTVEAWLTRHPSVQLVSRDGANNYRQGITSANPSILQVYDRWHFIQNAKKRLETYLSSIVPSTIEWGAEINNTEMESISLTRREKQTKEKQEQKWMFIQEIQQCHKKGLKIAQIARMYQLDWRTVRKYIQMNHSPSTKRVRTKSVHPFYNEIVDLEKKGHTLKNIVEIPNEICLYRYFFFYSNSRRVYT